VCSFAAVLLGLLAQIRISCIEDRTHASCRAPTDPRMHAHKHEHLQAYVRTRRNTRPSGVHPIRTHSPQCDNGHAFWPKRTTTFDPSALLMERKRETPNWPCNGIWTHEPHPCILASCSLRTLPSIEKPFRLRSRPWDGGSALYIFQQAPTIACLQLWQRGNAHLLTFCGRRRFCERASSRWTSWASPRRHLPPVWAPSLTCRRRAHASAPNVQTKASAL